MGKYLMDNSVIVKYFSGDLSKRGIGFISKVIDDIPTISVITEIESLSWVDPPKEEIVKKFVNVSIILEVNPEVVKQCVKIERSRRIKTPDAIIAATAIINNLTLLTCDNGFHGIDGLTIINPLKL
jgi:predicted nucleic acid-binding protein